MSAIRIRRSWEIPENQATPEPVYRNRRQILQGLGLGGLALALMPSLACQGFGAAARTRPALGRRFAHLFPAPRNPAYTLGDRSLTPEEIAATYNNFYEFTTTKDEVWKLAQGYSVDPWRVEVTGLVRKPRTLDLQALFTQLPLEERLYRFRCVERWAMQVPWTGYPLGHLLDLLQPLPSARYVRFVSIHDPENLPGQKVLHYPWPYYEGLRLDEARHELAFVAVGIYGHALPMQHGAPWRVVVPWKYGYKSPKSIVRIELTAEQPGTFWADSQPEEYGFYSNVNPSKPHPRWSQERERDISGEAPRKTLLYNGYADQVASLYTGSEH